MIERDPEKGNNDAKVNIRKEDSREFKQNIFYTWFTIPWEKLRSREDEDEFIRGTTEEAVSQMRLALKNSVFLECIETVFTEKMFKAMTNEQGYGFTLQKFIETCRVTVSRMENMNKYVVLDDSKSMQMFLFEKELPHKKYAFDTEDERKKSQENNNLKTPTKSCSSDHDSSDDDSDDDDEDKEDNTGDTSGSREQSPTQIVKIKIEPGINDDNNQNLNKCNMEDEINELKKAAYDMEDSDEDITDPTDTEGEDED